MGMVSTHVSRRSMLKGAAALGAAAAFPRFAGQRISRVGAQDDPWKTPPDKAKAAEQAKEIITYGMPDDWANYGDVYKGFWEMLGVADGKHTDTDMSSLEEITKYDAEKGNPIAMFSDIGMTYGPIASQHEVVPDYLPPSADKLPEGYKGATGGWVATFTGVPAIVVNNDALKALNVEIKTWDDLLKPELKGKVGTPGDPRSAGTAQASFLAWAYAHGGDTQNLQPAIDYSKQVIGQYNSASASVDLLEKGEIVCWVRYDFNCEAAVSELKGKNINAQTVIPGISIYAPSAMMVNKFNVAKKDASQMYMDFVLSDTAAQAFAKFGARPILYVLGKQELPADAKANWLPEDLYKDVKVVENFTGIDANKIADIWDNDVLNG